jgi:hypothetical protein
MTGSPSILKIESKDEHSGNISKKCPITGGNIADSNTMWFGYRED